MRDQIYIKLESNSFWEILSADSFYSAIHLCHAQTVSFNYILESRIICFNQLKGSVAQTWQTENKQNLKTTKTP